MSELLAKSLIKAQKQMVNVVYDAQGQVGNRKFEYTRLPTVLDYVRPIFNECGLSVAQFTAFTDGRTSLVTRVIAADGAFMDFPVHVDIPTGDPKGSMSAIAVARRGGLKMIAMIAETGEDDDGAQAGLQSEIFNEESAKTNCLGALSKRVGDDARATKIVSEWMGRFAGGKRTRNDWAGLWKAINSGEMDKVGLPDPLDTQTNGDASNA